MSSATSNGTVTSATRSQFDAAMRSALPGYDKLPGQQRRTLFDGYRADCEEGYPSGLAQWCQEAVEEAVADDTVVEPAAPVVVPMADDRAQLAAVAEASPCHATITDAMEAAHTAEVTVQPEAVQAAVAAAVQPAVDPAAAKAAAEAEEAAQRDALLATSDQEVKAMVRCVRKGERALLGGYMAAGKHCLAAIVARVGARHSRDAAVKHVEGQLAGATGVDVKANVLIRSWASWDLLAGATSKVAAAVPYSSYRAAWSRLVQSVDHGKTTEHYILLPGMEAECAALFAEGCQAGWNQADSEGHVAKLLHGWESARKAAADAAVKVAADKLAVETAAAKAAAAVTATAAAVVETAAAAVAAATTPDEVSATTKAMEDAREVMLQKQRDQLAVQAAADLARRQGEAANREAAAAGKAKAALEAKEARKLAGNGVKDTTPAPKPEPAVKDAAQDMLAIAKTASPADLAQHIHTLLLASKSPEDTFLALLGTMVASKAWPADITAAATMLHEDLTPKAPTVVVVAG